MRVSRGRVLIGCLLGVMTLGLIYLVGAAAFVLRRFPPMEALVPQTPILVTLTEPPKDTRLTLGVPIRVKAQVLSESPLRSLELWVDGSLLGTGSVKEGPPGSATASWTWSPEAEGESILFARATDSRGRTAQSNAVRVSITPESSAYLMERHVVEAGDSLESLAEAFGSSPGSILQYNPPLEPGQEIQVPVPRPAAEAGPRGSPVGESGPPPAPAAEPGPPPNNVLYWLGSNLLPAPDSPPQAPELQGGVDGCSVILRIGDRAEDEAGFFVYRFNPNASVFERIAVLGPSSGTGPISYVDQALFGFYAYYVASFNAVGETPGGQLRIDADDPACGAGDWTGIRLEDGRLEVNRPVDLAYIYLSVNAGPWKRVPADPEDYVGPQNGAYDFSPHLGEAGLVPYGSEVSLRLEAWGWEAGSLVYLGAGGGTVRRANANVQAKFPWEWTRLEGTGFTRADIERGFASFSDVVNIDVPKEVFFDWSTGSPSASSGRWQVSLFPFPPHPDPNPAGLVMYGAVQGNEGLFPVDFRAILGEHPEQAGERGQATQPLRRRFRLGQWPYDYDLGQQVNQVTFPPTYFPQDYYVRILPMDGDKLAGEPSNQVVVHFGPLKPPEYPFAAFPEGPLYEARIMDFTPPEFERASRWGCIVVTGYEEGALRLVAWPLGEYCPKPFRGGGGQGFDALLEDLGAFLEGAVNWVSEAYADLKNAVVDLALNALPFCDALGVEAECRMAVEAGIAAGLASMGIPPDLPNFDQLVGVGEGYLVDLAVEQAVKNSPVPCDSLCEDGLRKAIREGLDAGIDAVAKSSQAPGCVSADEAHKHGREPLCPPAGHIVKPAREAINRPPIVTLEVRRRPEVPDSKGMSCTLGLSLIVEKDYPGGFEGPFDQYVQPQHVTAELYIAKSFPMVDMAPGDTLTIVAAFDKGRPYFLPWTPEVHRGSQVSPLWINDWYYMALGSRATLTAADFNPLQPDVYQCFVSDQWSHDMPLK